MASYMLSSISFSERSIFLKIRLSISWSIIEAAPCLLLLPISSWSKSAMMFIPSALFPSSMASRSALQDDWLSILGDEIMVSFTPTKQGSSIQNVLSSKSMISFFSTDSSLVRKLRK